jgi:hypothetical protein
MSNKQYYINIPILFVFFCIGAWEAHIASTHQPDQVNLTDYEKEGYAFTVIRSIVNILFAFFGICVNQSKDNDKDNENKSDMKVIHFINLGTTIWCIIMYSNIINQNFDFGPFKQVIIAEFIIFITSVCFIVFVCCTLFAVTTPDENNVSTDNQEMRTIQILNEIISTKQPIVIETLPVALKIESSIISTTDQNSSVNKTSLDSHMIDIVLH